MVGPGARGVKRRDAGRSLVVIALGSNVGDRALHLAHGRAGLAQLGVDWSLASRVHETEPVGGPAGQRRFLNQVLAAEERHVALDPAALLDACLALEARAGRVRGAPGAPRTLDLDILFYGDRVVTSDSLTLPHPRAAGRAFVLDPLAEIAPDLVHPVLGRTVSELAASLHGSPRPGRRP